ncbi:MAG TPA: hypothetical protein VNJ02_19610 [Vicinamibacterales bacterium]|nr:hypothetical protein [Vicinamibacterales bacterium]
MTPADFTSQLLARGIELIVRGNRLRVWPGRAHKYGLTDSERAFLHAHRYELKALAGTFPEATVVWTRDAPLPVDPEPEPEPVMWTADYARRITEADVIAACGTAQPLGMSKREAYEHAREWLAEQHATRDRERRTQDMQHGIQRAQGGWS